MSNYEKCNGCSYYFGEMDDCMYGEADVPFDLPKKCEKRINKIKNTNVIGRENDCFRCTCLNYRVDIRPNFVIGSRRQGKTTLLIKKAYETNGVIVCPTHMMANYIFHMAQELGYSLHKPIIYDEMFKCSKGKRTVYYFDEFGTRLVLVLRRWLNDLEHDHVNTIIIDKGSIDSINDILGGMKISDMDGEKLRLKIEIFKEEDNDL